MIRRSWLLILSILAVLAHSNGGNAAFHGHVSIVNSVVFSADGKWALSGSWDWTMRLWDLSTHKSVHKFKDHSLSVNHAVFSPDGKQLMWTSNRTENGKSQLFIGRWDHAAAVAALGKAPKRKTETAVAEEPESQEPLTLVRQPAR